MWAYFRPAAAFEGRAALELNVLFSKYPVPRFRDVPPMETVLVDRPDLDSAGAGEIPIIPVAPALASSRVRCDRTAGALAAATGRKAVRGVRQRSTLDRSGGKRRLLSMVFPLRAPDL